ncbi:MAG: Ribonuclease [Labilithrix sp.]|nr:Ribonuclease [Labilithrix sp.]
MSPEVSCWTDGSARAGDGAPGGWGFVVKVPGAPPIEGYGSARGTLAKVMEYRAVAEALAVVPEGARAVVFSDNQSLVENLAKRLASWQASGFVNVDAAIAESVRHIATLVTERRLVVRYQWVRGHGGNAGNVRADALAAQGTREARSGR